jgi:long-chain acyl-CoA synthetase
MFDFNLKTEKAAFKSHNSIDSVADIVDHQLPSYGKRSAIRFDTGTTYASLSFDEYQRYIRAMIAFLEQQGAEREVMATFCKNRVEWDMTAMAGFYRANILFPLDTKMNDVELTHLLKSNPPGYVLVSRAQIVRLRRLLAEVGQRPRIILADAIDVFEDMGFDDVSTEPGELRMFDILAAHKDTPIEPARPLLADPDVVLGHYATSGTTSLSKIVEITHGNIVAEVNEAVDVLNLRHNEELLNIGPYTHIATLVEFLVTKTRGFSVTYFTREPDEDDVLEDEIKKLSRLGVRIKALMGVPKFWIYLLKEVLEEMKNKPILHNLYQHLISIEKNGQLHDIGTLEKAKLTAMRTLLRNKLGGYFSYGISSSMKLDGAIVRILGKLGVTVIDIYGATECAGIISRNRLNDVNPGSCGRIIEPLQHRLRNLRRVPGIAHEVGELQVRGPTVARSYLGRAPHEFAAADGYYNTGDLCWIDDDGLLHLLGREKELMWWDDGSYVDPQHLSNLLVRSIFVKDAMVARRRPEDDFLSVYLFPDYKRIRKDVQWQKELDTGVDEAVALKRRLQTAIDYAESIANITPRLSRAPVYVLPRALERTPTHKIKFLFELARLDQATPI